MSEEPPKSHRIVSRKDLDDYIADPFNEVVFQDLEEFGWKERAVYFFEWFHELVTLIEDGKPSAALQNLDAHKLDGPFRLWFVHHLRNRFRDPISIAGTTRTPKEMPPAFHVIDAEYERLEKLYPPDMFPSYEGIHAKATTAVATSKMTTTLLNDMLERMWKEGEEKRAHELQIRQDERERIAKEQIRIGREVLNAAKAQARNPEFTINRQVIAVCYLLRSLGVTANSSEKARFIEFLTDKNQKEIYKRVLAINDTVYNLEGRDAEYVRDWFVKLGLTKLAKEIDDVLGKPHEKL